MNPEDNGKMTTDWRQFLDERQLSEVKLAQLYAKDFKHGTDGHNRLILIDKLVLILEDFAKQVEKLQGES